MSVVVADSSPLNYLALLADFDLLRLLYRAVVIPPAVYEEVVTRGSGYPVQAAVTMALVDWMSVAEPPNATRVRALRDEFSLDLGESEAIVTAQNMVGSSLLMDERRGVKCARSLGMTVTRTPMIYANAKVLGLIGSVAVKLDELQKVGFRLSDEHYRLILQAVGEV